MGSEPSFNRLLEDKFLLADGTTGTNLFLKGLLTGDALELWNLIQPKKEKTHKSSREILDLLGY